MDVALPDDADLRRLIHFSVGDGRIWLAGHRMLLLHAEALGGLRRELMQTIGREHTRRAFMRAGYAAGQRDAALARQVRPNASVIEQFAVGPQLHMLEGAVQVTLETFEMDIAAGHHLARVRWDHSWEVETHLRDFGPQDQPVCWMLIGYASGYVTAFMGRPVIYRETECCACGHRHCRIEGRPVDAWPDGEQLARDYDADSVLMRIEDLQTKVDTLRSSLAATDRDLATLVGHSRAFRDSVELMRRAATTQAPVLFIGESGVGKARMARAMHALGPRAAKPFVTVHCASMPPELLEDDRLGANWAGRFERADGGTLFLDGVHDLSAPAQARLLRLLQHGEVVRHGSGQARRVDVRVVASTGADRAALVSSGRFRGDLMYKLSAFPIPVAPLRERPEDVEPLARHILAQYAGVHQKRLPGFTDRALDAMRGYAWPGNVRELENLVERGAILVAAGALIEVEDLFATPPGHATVSIDSGGRLHAGRQGSAEAILDEMQRSGIGLDELSDALIAQAVSRANGNLSAAARLLDITRPQLSYRVQRMQQRTDTTQA